MRKLGLLFLTVVVTILTLGVASRAHAAANEVYFPKTRELAWNGGTVLTKTLTSGAADTGFVTLPDDIAWQAYLTAGTNQVIRVSFYCPTAAANADTVHYVVQPAFYAASTVAGVPQGAPTYAFTDYRDFTAAVGNCAVHTSPGLIFSGAISISTSAPTFTLPGIPWPRASRLKVQADPNGVLANLRCQISYLSTTP